MAQTPGADAATSVGAKSDGSKVIFVRTLRSSFFTAFTRRRAAEKPLPAFAPTINRRSPAFRLASVPSSHNVLIPAERVCGAVWRGRIAFHRGRASICSTVSKACGCSPGPGMLCTFRPGSSVSVSGEPAVPSRVNARDVLAATPGLSS